MKILLRKKYLRCIFLLSVLLWLCFMLLTLNTSIIYIKGSMQVYSIILQDAKISMSMVRQTYPVITLVLLILISAVILFALINYSFNKIKRVAYAKSKTATFLYGLVFASLVGLGIFGRLNQYPLRWSDAFSFDDDFKANLSLNPIQSFLSTLQFINSKYDIKKVKAYYPLMVQYLGVKNPDSTDS